MFFMDRDKYLSQNELAVSTVIDIIDHKSGFCVLKDVYDMITVWTEDNKESFTAMLNGNRLKIVKINGENVDIRIKRGKNCGVIDNKKVGVRLEYNIEKFTNDINKITMLQEFQIKDDPKSESNRDTDSKNGNENNIKEAIKNTHYESYLVKDDDALLIAHAEEIYKKSWPITIDCDEDTLSLVIVNHNLNGVSEDDAKAYIAEQELGELKKYDKKEEDLEYYDYEDIEENEDLEDEETLEEYEEEYEGFTIMKNGEPLDDDLSGYKLIDDIYSLLVEENIYIDDGIISAIEVCFDEIKQLVKSKEDFDDPESSIGNENQDTLKYNNGRTSQDDQEL